MIDFANIKTIVVDLDKTLLHTDKTLSSYKLSMEFTQRVRNIC